MKKLGPLFVYQQLNMYPFVMIKEQTSFEHFEVLKDIKQTDLISDNYTEKRGFRKIQLDFKKCGKR